MHTTIHSASPLFSCTRKSFCLLYRNECKVDYFLSAGSMVEFAVVLYLVVEVGQIRVKETCVLNVKTELQKLFIDRQCNILYAISFLFRS